MQYNFSMEFKSEHREWQAEGLAHSNRLELLMGDLSRRQRLTLVSLLKGISDSVTSRQLPVSSARPARMADESGLPADLEDKR